MSITQVHNLYTYSRKPRFTKPLVEVSLPGATIGSELVLT